MTSIRIAASLVLFASLSLVSCSKSAPEDNPVPQDSETIETNIEYVLAEGVKVCTEDEAKSISDTSSTTTDKWSDGMFKSASLLAKDGFGTGRIFVLPPCEAYPDGLIAEVSNFDEPSGKIWYRKKKLEDVFKSLNLQAGGEIGQYVKEIRDASGKSVAFSKTKAIGKDHISIELPKTYFRNLEDNIGVTIEGKIDLPMMISIVINDFTLVNSSFKINPSFDVNLELKAEYGSTVVEKKYPFLTVICGAFIVGPVVITPLVQLSLYISAEGKLGMTATVKYKQKSTLQMIYDRSAGFSADAKQFENTSEEPFKFGSSLYIEGNMYTGLDLSAGIGIFGDALYATVGIQKKVKCGGQYKFNVQDYFGNFHSWYAATASSLFYTDLATQGVAALNTFGGEYLGNVKTSEQTERLDSAFFVPKVRARLISGDENSARVEISASHRTLLPMDIGYRVYKSTPKDAGFDTMSADYFSSDPKTFTEETSLGEFILPAGADSLTFPLNFRLEQENAKYRVCPYIQIGGTAYELSKEAYSAYFESQGNAFKAFARILNDVSKSLANVPESWFSDRQVSDWDCVLVSTKNNIPHMTLLCQDLSFKSGTLEVGDYSNIDRYSWELSGIGTAGDNLVSVDIQDRNFYDGVFSCTNLESLKIASDIFCRNNVFNISSRENLPLKTLELGGKFPFVKNLYLYKKALPELSRVSVSGMEALKTVDFDGNRGHKVEFTPENCPVLTDVKIYNDGTDVMKAVQSGPSGQTWTITGCGFDTFTIGDKFACATLQDCTFGMLSVTSKTASQYIIKSCTIGSLNFNGYTGARIGGLTYEAAIDKNTIEAMSVTNCPEVAILSASSNSSLNNIKVGSLSVSACPKLTEIWADELNMTSFSLDAAGAIRKLYMQKNPITAIVPAVFEQIWSNGGDIRIDWLWNNGRELDHGYYYSDEPDVWHSHSWVR